MSQSPLLTLIAGAVGATIGLSAPLISGTLARRAASRDNQRAVAQEILSLYGLAPLSALIGEDSPLRRKLFSLALQLHDQKAYQACKDLVDAAAEANASAELIFPEWETMNTEVRRTFRQS
jgi:hypothetical protein